MALTAEGKQLTEAHRLRQLAIAAQADVVARALWRDLDVSDLDASTPSWLAANLLAAERFYNQSSQLASEYVTRYRQAELGDSSGPLVRPAFSALINREILQAAGPVRVKLLVGRGMDPGGAHTAAVVKYSGIYRRQALEGGRMMIAETGGADVRAQGWRRVTDGNPCAFCAMLASRGPVYTSKEKATETGGERLRYHGHCGCTAEIIYGEWKPSELEQQYIDAYERAAQKADAEGRPRVAPKPGSREDTILYRMRRDEFFPFRDSPNNRNKTPGSAG